MKSQFKIVNLHETKSNLVKSLIRYLFLFTTLIAHSQIRQLNPEGAEKQNEIKQASQKKDSIKKKLPQLPASRYKSFNIENDTIQVDTTLSIRDAYRFNQLFKDDFDYLPFSNIGYVLTNLSYNVKTDNLLPGFVAQSKLTDYWYHNQVPFYKTPTPYSDISYLNGIGQGQILKVIFASNINKRLNISAGYRGLSSLGLYKNSIATSGRFSGSLNYKSKNNLYQLKFYYYTYEKTNEENGGLKYPEQFEQSGDIFSDRSRIEVNLSDAQTQLVKRRLYAGQEYALIKEKLHLIDELTYHTNAYKFEQNIPDNSIGTSSINSAIKDSVYLDRLENLTALKFSLKQKIELRSGLRYVHQTYGFDSLKIIQTIQIPKKLTYDDLILDNKMNVNLGQLQIDGQLNIGFTNNLSGYYLKGSINYMPNEETAFTGQIKSISKRPDFKYILYQSAYDKYNWNHTDYKNELTQDITGNINYKNWGNLTFKQIIINNYTYFGTDSLAHQNAQGVKYTSLKYQKDLSYKKWGLATDFKLQKVLQGSDLLHLPTYIIRSSLFYSNYFYQHNLYIQTGFTVKYFEAYYADAYNPVLSDFVLQENQKIGGYPILDYFINLKIKRFRFYLKLAHINALTKQKYPDYYAAPLEPYQDFNIRFGLRWIFFN